VAHLVDQGRGSCGIDRIERVLTDNGSCYRSRDFAAALVATDTLHKRTRPYRPQTNGKVERLNRTLLDEWAYAQPYPSETARRAACPTGYTTTTITADTARSAALPPPASPTSRGSTASDRRMADPRLVATRLSDPLLAELRAAGQLDLDRCAVDASHVDALEGGPRRPVAGQPRHPGSKHHLIVNAHGIPLAVTLTGGHRHDVTQLLALLDEVPPIRGLRGRPRRKPRQLFADRGYDFDKYRRLLRGRGITPAIARRAVAHGSGLGKVRWVVERGFAWPHAYKRLRTRYERRADIHLGLLQLACALICYRQLARSF
jgi:transposase